MFTGLPRRDRGSNGANDVDIKPTRTPCWQEWAEGCQGCVQRREEHGREETDGCMEGAADSSMRRERAACGPQAGPLTAWMCEGFHTQEERFRGGLAAKEVEVDGKRSGRDRWAPS
ncbi:unnamed protein product [Boreogadus saida]